MTAPKKVLPIKAGKKEGTSTTHNTVATGFGSIFYDGFVFGQTFPGPMYAGGPQTEPPLVWENVVGSYTVGYNVGFGDRNGLVVASLDGGKAIAVVDAAANFQMETSLDSKTAFELAGPTRAGFVTRYSDPLNYILLYLTHTGDTFEGSPRLKIIKVENGVETFISNDSEWTFPVDAFTFGFRSVEDQIQIFNQHIFIGYVKTSFNQTATKHGFYSESLDSTFDYVQGIPSFTSEGHSNATDIGQSTKTAGMSGFGDALGISQNVHELFLNYYQLGSFLDSSYGVGWTRESGTTGLSTFYLWKLEDDGGISIVDSALAGDWDGRGFGMGIGYQTATLDENTMIVPVQKTDDNPFDTQLFDTGLLVLKRSGGALGVASTYHFTDITYPIPFFFNSIKVVALDPTHIVVTHYDVFGTSVRFYFFTLVGGDTLVPTVLGQVVPVTSFTPGNIHGTLRGRLWALQNSQFVFIDYDGSGVTGVTEVTWPQYPHYPSAGGSDSFQDIYAWDEETGEVLAVYSIHVPFGTEPDDFPLPVNLDEKFFLLPALWDGGSFSFGTPQEIGDVWYNGIDNLGNIASPLDSTRHRLGGSGALTNIPVMMSIERNQHPSDSIVANEGVIAYTTVTQSGTSLTIADPTMPTLYVGSNSVGSTWYSDGGQLHTLINGQYLLELFDSIYSEQFDLVLGGAGRTKVPVSGENISTKVKKVSTKVHVKA